MNRPAVNVDPSRASRARRVLVVVPELDVGGVADASIALIRELNRAGLEVSVATTAPSLNRGLVQIEPDLHELWAIPDLMSGAQLAEFIFDFLDSREVDALHLVHARLGCELLADLSALRRPPKVVVQICGEADAVDGLAAYVAARYGNLVSAFGVSTATLVDVLIEEEVPSDRIHLAPAYGELYDRLLSEHPPPPEAARPVDSPLPSKIAFRRRRRRGGDEPELVSVVVPCFNHGLYLEPCLDSVAQQTYPAIEVIVVDNGSTETTTLDVIAELEHRGAARVVRLPTRPPGVTVRRNAGISVARGRYILPLDADNLLLPHAVESLLAQLDGAPERVGFVYPHLQFFGNRSDYIVMQEYNLYQLMLDNFCDSSSLFAREVFDAGLRYDETISCGSEDWDFALTLGEHGVEGVPANEKTLLMRKRGFSRNDRVAYRPTSYTDELRQRHPALYGDAAHEHPWVGIKSRWAPAVTLLATAPIRSRGDLAAALEAQSCQDFEVIAAEASGAAADESQVRGGIIVATQCLERIVRDRAFVEKTIRLLHSPRAPRAIAFAAASQGGHTWRPLARGESAGPPHTVAWRVHRELATAPPTLPGASVDELVRSLLDAGIGDVDWRHTTGALEEGESDRGVQHAINLSLSCSVPVDVPPAIPAMRGGVRRWGADSRWISPFSVFLFRHREIGSELRFTSNEADPPGGYAFECVLGAVRLLPFPETAELRLDPDGAGYRLDTDATSPAGVEPGSLGHLECRDRGQMTPLLLARHPVTGQQLLVAGRDDPLLGAVEPLYSLGYLDPTPPEPAAPLRGESDHGLLSLTRHVDREARRHRYETCARAVRGEADELGALLDRATPGSEPVWLGHKGLLITRGHQPSRVNASRLAAARWIVDPLRWRGPWPAVARARAVTRRALDVLRVRGHPRGDSGDPCAGEPAGHLFAAPGRGRVPLYCAPHPVIEDQLLSTDRDEARELGYAEPTVVGYVAELEPNGAPASRRITIPWASHFGARARS